MMNKDFLGIIKASDEDRRGLFLSTANRLNTTIQNIEKDFWACWMLDIIFNERMAADPRILFKGRTSLSKGYSLISRFSEDLDITFFREDLGLETGIGQLKNLSRKQQKKHIDNIKQAAQNYIHGRFKSRLEKTIGDVYQKIHHEMKNFLIADETDSQQQTLLMHYPSVINENDSYIKPTIKIEAGAKSALEPHQTISIQPYISADLPELNLTVPNIAIINPERTFWDKVIILHGIHSWYHSRGELRQNGHRISRHYYDLHELLTSPIGNYAIKNTELAKDCADHARLFFNSALLDLGNAKHGSFTLIPTPEMAKILKRDYLAMAGMIFGEKPTFENILASINDLENILNGEKIR